MTDNGQSPTPEQQIEMLQAELNDAHLVIGQQHVALLRLQMALREKESALRESRPPMAAEREER